MAGEKTPVEIKSHLGEVSRTNSKRTPEFNPVSPKVMKSCISVLERKGVRFEIGTENAKTMLESRKALGLYLGIWDWQTNTRIRTIYLYENPAASTFLEECYHAVQSLEGLPRIASVTFKGKTYNDIDNWEFLAKKRILDEADKNNISYEEYIFIEEQLEEVLNKEY